MGSTGPTSCPSFHIPTPSSAPIPTSEELRFKTSKILKRNEIGSGGGRKEKVKVKVKVLGLSVLVSNLEL